MPLVSIKGRHMKALPGSQVFNSTGTFIVPNGYNEVVICICGGGGSGGGNFGNFIGGGGGGSGVLKKIVPVFPGESIAVTIAGSMAYTPSQDRADSSIFAAVSGTITAIGGISGFHTSNVAGAGANGGGDGGKGDIISNSASCPPNPIATGKDCSATCDGSTFTGGLPFCGTSGSDNNGYNDLYSGGGGAGGFGPGGGNRTAGGANTGAGGAGSSLNENGFAGGSGKCIVYWGNTHPLNPAPTL